MMHLRIMLSVTYYLSTYLFILLDAPGVKQSSIWAISKVLAKHQLSAFCSAKDDAQHTDPQMQQLRAEVCPNSYSLPWQVKLYIYQEKNRRRSLNCLLIFEFHINKSSSWKTISLQAPIIREGVLQRLYIHKDFQIDYSLLKGETYPIFFVAHIYIPAWSACKYEQQKKLRTRMECMTPQRATCTSSWWEGEQPSRIAWWGYAISGEGFGRRTTLGATRGGQAHQEPRKAGQSRRQVLERHLRAKEALMGPPASLPYQERSGHHLA